MGGGVVQSPQRKVRPSLAYSFKINEVETFIRHTHQTRLCAPHRQDLQNGPGINQTHFNQRKCRRLLQEDFARKWYRSYGETEHDQG